MEEFTKTQKKILNSLFNAGGPITPNKLAQRTGYSRPTCKEHIDRLEKKGYVICKKEGRRKFCIFNYKKYK